MGGQVRFVGQEISEVRPEPCIKVRGYRNRVMALQTEGSICADSKAREDKLENIKSCLWLEERGGEVRKVSARITGLNRSVSKVRNLILKTMRKMTIS